MKNEFALYDIKRKKTKYNLWWVFLIENISKIYRDKKLVLSPGNPSVKIKQEWIINF